MGLVHGQIQDSNARTRLRLYERVANHVGWNPMQTSNAGTRLPSILPPTVFSQAKPERENARTQPIQSSQNARTRERGPPNRAKTRERENAAHPTGPKRENARTRALYGRPVTRGARHQVCRATF